MSNMIAESNVKESEIRITITRADGTIEDLGVVGYYSKNPLKMFWWNTKQFFKKNIKR